MMARNSVSLRNLAQASRVAQNRNATNESGARQRTAKQIARALEVAPEVTADVASDAVVGIAESDGGSKHRHRSFQLATIRRSLRRGSSRASERAAKPAFLWDMLIAEPFDRGKGRAQIFYLGGVVRRRRLER